MWWQNYCFLGYCRCCWCLQTCVCVCVFCFRFGIGSTSGSNKKVVGVYWTRSRNSRVTCSACSDTSANICLSTASTNHTLHCNTDCCTIWYVPIQRYDWMSGMIICVYIMRILSPSCCGSDHAHTHTQTHTHTNAHTHTPYKIFMSVY